MEIDAGLWALLACTIVFVIVGCFMTATDVVLQNLGLAARRRPPDQH